MSGTLNNMFATMQADMGNAYSSISSMFGTPSLASPSKAKPSIIASIDALPLYVKIAIIIVVVLLVIALGYLLMD